MMKPIGYMMGLGVCLALPLGLTSGDCGKIGAAKAACGAEPVSLTAAACGAEPVSATAKASECDAAKAACGAEAVSLTAAACGAEPVSTKADACPAGESKKLAVAQYKVDGMSCGACESKLTGELEKVAGVSKPSACAKSGIAKLSYDAGQVKKEELMAAIRRAGYTVTGEVVELKLEGVDCGGCTSQVTRALQATRGVKEHKVSHEEKLAVVTFDPAATCVDSVVAAIGRSGFKAVH
jgi:copper chaperone CopZ